MPPPASSTSLNQQGGGGQPSSSKGKKRRGSESDGDEGAGREDLSSNFGEFLTTPLALISTHETKFRNPFSAGACQGI